MVDFSQVQGVAFDFDGVFTDNHVIVNQNGEESVICSRFDGIGISKLKRLNVPIIVISTEVNQVVIKRCEKLGIYAVNNCPDKKSMFEGWIKNNELDPKCVIFMGNDTNDFEVMSSTCIPVAVADAVPEIINIAKHVTIKNGGKGAVRELCDLIAESKDEL